MSEPGEEEENDGSELAMGMGVGIAFGVALGAATDNLAIGIPSGWRSALPSVPRWGTGDRRRVAVGSQRVAT